VLGGKSLGVQVAGVAVSNQPQASAAGVHPAAVNSAPRVNMAGHVGVGCKIIRLRSDDGEVITVTELAGVLAS
jgi:hypothetical protein